MVSAAHQRVYDTLQKFVEHSENLSWDQYIFIGIIHSFLSFPLQLKAEDLNKSDHSSSVGHNLTLKARKITENLSDFEAVASTMAWKYVKYV